MKIIPDYIPEDAAPINASTLLENAVNARHEKLIEGKNMFVSLLTGEVKVGRIEFIDDERFTVGNSQPIHFATVESARET